MRLHLTFALLVILLLYFTIRYSRPYKFSYQNVVSLAQEMSRKPYDTSPGIDPALLKILQNLTVDQVNDIRWKDSATVWKKQALPFQIKFWHLGKWHVKPVHINTVNQHGSNELRYSPKFFDFGANQFDVNALPDSLGYAGFRIHYPLNRTDYLDEVASFSGASYYRVLAKDQWYGLSARGLALDTANWNEPERKMEPEEFPDFTDFWLLQPAGNTTELQIYALMQSPSVTGAYSFKIRPGVESIVDVQCTLFIRKKVKRFGIAPLTSMYLFGENSREHVNDIHPELHDSDGLLVHNGKGEWLWRPLQTRPHLQEYYFEDENPKGFGLMQRDHDFQHYQDLEAHYQNRPSCWEEPIGNWGKGTVSLLQNTSVDVNQDNVVLMWSPEKSPEPGTRLDLSYRMTFFTNDSQIPPLATVKQMFVNLPPPASPAPPKPPTKPLAVAPPPKAPPPPVTNPHPGPALVGPIPPPSGNLPHVVLDFVGNGINLPKDNQSSYGPIPNPEFWSVPPGKLTNLRIVPNPEDNSWRVSFDIIGTEPRKTVELNGRLVSDNKPISETWTYTWYPADSTPSPPPPAPSKP